MDSEQSDASKDTDKLLRNRNSSRLGARFGKYFGKLSKNTKHRDTNKPSEEVKDSTFRKRDAKDNILKKVDNSLRQSDSKDLSLKQNDTRKGKNYSKKRPDSRVNRPQDKPASIVKENKKGRYVIEARSKLMTPEHDSDYEDKEQHFKRGATDKRNSNKGGAAYNRLRRNTSVTFSPIVTCTTDTAHKTKPSTATKKMPAPIHLRSRLVASETSDTDSTTQEMATV